jgi:hypothetical protein
VSKPNTKKTNAETLCTHRMDTRRATASPKYTAGALASIMPRVEPVTTAVNAS